MARCLTPIDFERYARGELDPQGSAHLERHVTECGRCRAAYESFVRSDHQLADDKPAGANAPRLVSRIDETVSQQSSPRPDSSPERPPSPQPRLPQIGGYEIRRIIGRGGMGVVYEAVQQKLSRTVALDAVCSSLINYDPMEISTTRIAAERRLGTADLAGSSAL